MSPTFSMDSLSISEISDLYSKLPLYKANLMKTFMEKITNRIHSRMQIAKKVICADLAIKR